jgi:long-subunit acyl-CoA synthetase (AMP-forming)
VILVVPDQDLLQDWIKKKGKDSMEELKITIMKDLTRLANEKGLKSMERPRQITLAPEPFSDANGLLTPS